MSEEVSPRSLEDILSDMFYAEVRVEKMWPFPSGPGHDELADIFSMYDDAIPEQIKSLYVNWSEEFLDDLHDGMGSSFNDAFEELSAAAFVKRRFGFLALVATPVMHWYSDTSSSFSWGHYHTGLLFSETAEGVLEEAIKWAAERHESTKGEKD